VTIDIRNGHFTTWTRLEAPTVEVPYWHEAEDPKAIHDLRSVTSGLNADDAAPIQDLHIQAIAAINVAAFLADRAGNHTEARRHVAASARLCQQIIGGCPVRLSVAA
jgi:hypothetical protein